MFRTLLAAAVTALVPLGATLAPAPADAATATSACAGVITVEQSGFSPPSVPAGQASTLTVTVRNCTSQAVQGEVWWFGTYTAGNGLAQNCPVLDPLAQGYSIAPQGTYTFSTREGVGFPGCQPTGLRMTVDFSATGVSGLAAQTTANLVIVQPGQQAAPRA